MRNERCNFKKEMLLVDRELHSCLEVGGIVSRAITQFERLFGNQEQCNDIKMLALR
jgi:hypothetical protein